MEVGMKEIMKQKKIVIGILAHVDAGKTTLAESILYATGKIRKPGRVDHKDAYLDTYDLERQRGITIFSKQAEVKLGNKEITLLDTPGHVDFSAEMERTLQVLDYAILIVSGADGIQGHIKTLWRLLELYQIPTFLFVNKMDQQQADQKKLEQEISKLLSTNCITFSGRNDKKSFLEEIAMSDEAALEEYLELEELTKDTIQKLILKRKLFPCYYGSALRMEGISEFLSGIENYTLCQHYPDTFEAQIYKISRDANGNRLTHMKITGGSLKVKTPLHGNDKVDQIRIYSGSSYELVPEAFAGCICTVTGLSGTRAGEHLGANTKIHHPHIEPVLTYRIDLLDSTDLHGLLLKLKQLEEEIPELRIVWDSASNEIHAQVMGSVQIEILKSIVKERYGIAIEFGEGSIVYKETIEEQVEGNGHYEPLRHYAEVRLLMQPMPRGTGIVFESRCLEDQLDRNWQRLIETHVHEKAHKGALTGSEVTDMKIILVNGKAHLKHTEGGDFREATYRAIRQGLMKAKNVLLEPIYEYQLEVPSEMIGRAMTDIQNMHGTFSGPEVYGEHSVIKGCVPVACMKDYPLEVVSYTKGEGRFFYEWKGYDICHNPEEVIGQIQYQPELDFEHPASSVFCSHGAGYAVPWDEVDEKMHTESMIKKRVINKPEPSRREYIENEEELMAIFERTYGTRKRRIADSSKLISAVEYTAKEKKQNAAEEILLVDGYNIIFAWPDLKELVKVNVDAARDKLMDILCNYQGYKKHMVIVVFDGYKVPGNIGEVMKYHNLYVVYTKEAETADQYIEKIVHKMDRKYRVTVATSDALEQVIIMGKGAQSISANDLFSEIEYMNEEIRTNHLSKAQKNKQYLFDHLSDELSEMMDDIRLGRREIE